MNGLFLPILSLQKPEKAFISEAVLSAIPSISERLVFDAPIDIRNIGITEYTIFTEVSVRKLVNPVNRTFLSKPRYLFPRGRSDTSFIPGCVNLKQFEEINHCNRDQGHKDYCNPVIPVKGHKTECIT